jgi:hypothetical protein
MKQSLNSRRIVLRGATGVAAAGMLGVPLVGRGQSDSIVLGHLTPRTGFLGPLGELGVQAADLAVEQINAEGGIMGRKMSLIKEDSVNPQTASTKAERLIERDKVAAIVGEISSASCLTIAQVAQRTKNLFINTGGNSDALRGANCNRYMFHVESQNSMYVKTCGQSLLSQGLVKDKKWFSLTADYAFGHDLLRVAKLFMEANGGRFAADKLVPTDATDFSALLLEIRPDVPGSRVRLRHRRCLGRRQGQLFRHMAAGVAPPAGDTGLEEVCCRLHQEVRQAPGEPGLGRLQRGAHHRAQHAGDQVHRTPQDHRAPGKGREVRRHEGA